MFILIIVEYIYIKKKADDGNMDVTWCNLARKVLLRYCRRSLYINMDVAEQAVKSNQVKDSVGERCLKLFQDFLEE